METANVAEVYLINKKTGQKFDVLRPHQIKGFEHWQKGETHAAWKEGVRLHEGHPCYVGVNGDVMMFAMTK